MKKMWLLIFLVVVSTVLVWLPFGLRVMSLPGWDLNFAKGMDIVFSNFDGPNYLIVEKSWYDKAFIGQHFSVPLPLEYYAAHLPLYPFLISVLDLVISGPWAMLLMTLLGSVLAAAMFYFFSKEIVGEKKAFWLNIAFLRS